MDIDIYNEKSEKIDVSDIPPGSPIKVTIGRMKEKDKALGVLRMPEGLLVNVTVSVCKQSAIMGSMNFNNRAPNYSYNIFLYVVHKEKACPIYQALNTSNWKAYIKTSLQLLHQFVSFWALKIIYIYFVAF